MVISAGSWYSDVSSTSTIILYFFATSINAFKSFCPSAACTGRSVAFAVQHFSSRVPFISLNTQVVPNSPPAAALREGITLFKTPPNNHRFPNNRFIGNLQCGAICVNIAVICGFNLRIKIFLLLISCTNADIRSTGVAVCPAVRPACPLPVVAVQFK